jgi:predicted MFS family arabinose efflux permease
MLISFGAVAVGVGLTTLMRTAWQLHLLWGVVVGLGTGTTAMVLAATVANRWFVARRGLVLGLLSASSAMGQLLFLPLVASIVVGWGWRSATLFVAALAVVTLPVIAIFARDDPRDLGLRPFGAPAHQVEPPRSTANPVAQAFRALGRGLRSIDFWLLAGSFFICGLSTMGLIGTHLIPASVEHGISEVMAAGLLATMGVFNLIGSMGSGWLSDRWDSRRLLCWYYGLRGLSLLFLPYALGSRYFGLGLFIVFYGLDWIATLPPTVRLTADIFGRQNVGLYFGWISMFHQLGAAVAAFGAGTLRTWLGNYQVSFMAAGLVCFIAAGLVLRIGDPARVDVVPVPPLGRTEPVKA